VDTAVDNGSEFLPSSQTADYAVEKIVEPGYSSDLDFRDHNAIALVRVNRDIDFSSLFVSPVCLPTEDNIRLRKWKPQEMDKIYPRKRIGWVAGFGRTLWGSAINDNLTVFYLNFSKTLKKILPNRWHLKRKKDSSGKYC